MSLPLLEFIDYAVVMIAEVATFQHLIDDEKSLFLIRLQIEVVGIQAQHGTLYVEYGSRKFLQVEFLQELHQIFVGHRVYAVGFALLE